MLTDAERQSDAIRRMRIHWDGRAHRMAREQMRYVSDEGWGGRVQCMGWLCRILCTILPTTAMNLHFDCTFPPNHDTVCTVTHDGACHSGPSAQRWTVYIATVKYTAHCPSINVWHEYFFFLDNFIYELLCEMLYRMFSVAVICVTVKSQPRPIRFITNLSTCIIF